MKIDYKILWLDDQIDAFIDDEHVEEIEKFLDEEGFDVVVDTVSNEVDFFHKLDDSYDLILTDYHMENMNGDKIVEAIRAKSIFTEILFYTARADLKDTQMLDRISFFETNSSQEDHAEAVVIKTKELISLTIRKFQDIVVMRGMIMHETSDLDAQQLEILNSYIEEKTVDETNSLKYEILKKIDKHFSKKLSFVNGDWKTNDNGFKKLMKDNFVFSSDYKIQTLSKILQDIDIEDFSDKYKEDIITIRNRFAHVTLKEDRNESGQVIRKYFTYGEDGITFDDASCKKIRKNIHKHKENLKNLKIKLNE
jgi:CheY-like chemotaxis protein